MLKIGQELNLEIINNEIKNNDQTKYIFESETTFPGDIENPDWKIIGKEKLQNMLINEGMKLNEITEEDLYNKSTEEVNKLTEDEAYNKLLKIWVGEEIKFTNFITDQDLSGLFHGGERLGKFRNTKPMTCKEYCDYIIEKTNWFQIFGYDEDLDAFLCTTKVIKII